MLSTTEILPIIQEQKSTARAVQRH